jgi:hypothetical protein
MKILDKIPLWRLPFSVKLFIAKVFIRTLRGFGPTYPDDCILYRELSLWIETKGRPTTSNPNYWINTK